MPVLLDYSLLENSYGRLRLHTAFTEYPRQKNSEPLDPVESRSRRISLSHAARADVKRTILTSLSELEALGCGNSRSLPQVEYEGRRSASLKTVGFLALYSVKIGV